MNPQQTIPVLEDNGAFLSDSHAICAYLCDKYADTDSLYPKDLVKRAHCDTRMHFDSSLFARLYSLYTPIMFKHGTEWSAQSIELIQKSYDILERFLENGPYVCGDAMTIADFCLIATVSSLDENVELDAEKHVKIIEWMDRMAQLPYYDETNGARSKAFQAYVRASREKNVAEAEADKAAEPVEAADDEAADADAEADGGADEAAEDADGDAAKATDGDDADAANKE